MNMEINPSEYKVLIVDDVISNVLLLKVLLTNEKFKIVTAGNGTQALEQVKKENPDLVLLDVMMPDISGFEVAQQMKADPEMAEIPIIFLTALNSTADIVKGFQVLQCRRAIRSHYIINAIKQGHQRKLMLLYIFIREITGSIGRNHIFCHRTLLLSQ